MKQASPGLRVAVASLGALHAAVFGWAAVELPWKAWTFFSIATGVVAVGYVAVACLAAFGRGPLGPVWRAQSFLSLGWALALGSWLLHSASRVASLYGGIGEGVAAGLFVVFAALLLFTLPFALWGIGWTGGVKRSRRTGLTSAVVTLVVVGWLASTEAQVSEQPLLSASKVDAVAKSLHSLRVQPLNFGPSNLYTPQPAQCARGFAEGSASVLVTFRRSLGTGPNTTVESRCVQGRVDAVAAKVQAELDRLHAQGKVKVDIVRSAARLDAEQTFAMLMVRPGLDGICWAKRCFAPWQLVATSAFVAHTPFPPVADARLGVSFSKLQHLLSGDESAPRRIETLSLLLDGDKAHALTRLPKNEAKLSAQAVAQSVTQANGYIRRSLREDGTFNYLLNPHTGEVTMGSLSIPRQAGTTLVLCELGDPHSTATAKRALRAIAEHEHAIAGGASVLSVNKATDDSTVRMGSSALSLVAFLRCRDKVGKRHDALIERVANALLKLERPDGGFWHTLDAQGRPGKERSLYIDGQIMFALVLLEASKGIAGVDHDEVHAALTRAYAYFAEDYWPAMLGEFFYLEENWHCLAARAALDVHRNDGYESFCIEYARMKSRLLLGDEAHPDFQGAFGFGNVVPPHNTATAGFGEAAAAALTLAKRRGEDAHARSLSGSLERSLTFLLRNQLGGPSCFACTEEPSVEGAFSEHMASPVIRIDYVQHAMAALGHGGRELGLLEES